MTDKVGAEMVQGPEVVKRKRGWPRGGVQRDASAGAQQVNKCRGGEDVVQGLCRGCAEVVQRLCRGADELQRRCRGAY